MIKISRAFNKSKSPAKDKLALQIKPMDGRVFHDMNNIPGYKKWMEELGRVMWFAHSEANIKWLLNNYEDQIEFTDNFAQERFSEVKKSISNSQYIVDRLASDIKELAQTDNYEYKRPPFTHQQKGFIVSRDLKVFAWLMEQGTGKTKITLDNAMYLYRKNLIDCLVVVAWPKGVHVNWIDYECPKDLHSDQYKAAAWNSDKAGGKRYKAELKVFAENKLKNKLKIMTFNVETFTGKGGKEAILMFLNNNRCMLVIDQSASIKTNSAKRTKFLIDECADLASYKRILDGDPNSEGAEELYSQYYFLDREIIGHYTYTSFKAEFCKTHKWGGHRESIVGYKNIDELQKRIAGYTYRVLSDNCQDLPDRIYNKWSFSLTKEERRIYDDLITLDEAEFQNNLLEIDSPLVKSIRLKQVSNGYFPGEEGELLKIDNVSSRMTALQLLLQQIKGKVIIYCLFRDDVENICAAYPNIAVSFYGGMSQEETSKHKAKFIEDKRIKYIVGTHRKLAIGHTLTAANNIIFYNNSDALRFRTEGEKRAHRTGQTQHINIWDLIGKATLDAKTRRSLRDKKEVSELILNDPQSWFLYD